MNNTLLESYSASMTGAHAGVPAHPAVLRLLDPSIEPRLLHRFLIEYCALGVQVTAPVSGWISRAGVRCKEIGLSAVGDNLVKHAVHEDGHDRMFVDDTRRLTAEYNSRYADDVDAASLLSQAATPAMRRYIELHEKTIAGPAPFAQVAIELEIEGLSVSLGPSLLQQLERVLGRSIVECCSFLTEHVAIDVGHTALNKKILERLLVARPESLGVLVETGTLALGAYLDFFGECLERAERSIAARRAPAN